MEIKFFDIHAHVQFPEFDSDREEVITRMKEKNVGAFFVGTDRETSTRAIEYAKKYENIFATVGLHPNDTTKEIFDTDFFEQCAKEKKVVAIGECGLDYFRSAKTEDEKEIQKKIFREHIRIAVENNLPLMIHVRDAHEDCISILTEEKIKYGEKLRGNIHFFSGTEIIARQYNDLGFTISFTGVITFAREYDDVIKNIPLEMIMTETDCPFVTPVPHRGKRNEPAFVQEVVKQIALIRGEDEEKVREIILSNTKRVFHLRT